MKPRFDDFGLRWQSDSVDTAFAAIATSASKEPEQLATWVAGKFAVTEVAKGGVASPTLSNLVLASN